MLGCLFLILTLVALERFHRGKPRALWFLPGLFLIWINTHGSWIVGLGVIIVHIGCGLIEFSRRNVKSRRWSLTERIQLESVLLFCLASLVVTPYGTELAAYPFEVALSLPVNIANISEWRSMPFNTSTGTLFLALLFGFILLRATVSATWRLEELVLFIGGTIMACLHVRFLLIFVPFFLPVLAQTIAPLIPEYDQSKDRLKLNAAVMIGVSLMVISRFPSRTELNRRIEDRFPVRAVEYLRSHGVPGPMFNSYSFGGYLLWAWNKEQKVFIDGRGELYERGGVLADYVHISMLRPGAMSVLRAYGVQSCLVEQGEPLATVLSGLADWQKVYSDGISALFIHRKESKTTGLVDRLKFSADEVAVKQQSSKHKASRP
jgi:hypothetical protein